MPSYLSAEKILLSAAHPPLYFQEQTNKTSLPLSLRRNRIKNNRMNKLLYPNKGLEALHFNFQNIKCCDLLEISCSEVITKLVIFSVLQTG